MQRKEQFQTFCEATITLTPKPDKDSTKKENYLVFKDDVKANITDEHRCKNPQQNFANRIQQPFMIKTLQKMGIEEISI